jgi:hypothetical protein
MRRQFGALAHRRHHERRLVSNSSRPTEVVAGDDDTDDVYFSNSDGTYSVLPRERPKRKEACDWAMRGARVA